jgi:uncharacterized membrane protein YoaK (UPF0700 family)
MSQASPLARPESPPADQPGGRAISSSAMLAFAAGFVDVVGFVALFGLFTSHVTGNFVVLGSEIVHTQAGMLAKVLALPMFAVGVAFTRLLVLYHERRGWAAARTLLLIEAAMLAVFMLSGVAVSPVIDPDALAPILVGMAGVFAMAIQNAASRLVFAAQAPTTVMTGNSTQVVIDLIDMRHVDPDLRAKAVKRLRLMLPSVLAFAAGAVAGAYGYLFASFWCLLVPIAGLLVATVLTD